jgi:hypothetical protein
MAINKSFGYLAESRGIELYPTMLLGLLAVSAIMLVVMILLVRRSAR